MKLQLLLFCFCLLAFFNTRGQTYTGSGGLILDDGRISDYRIDVDLADSLTIDFGLTEVCINLTHSWVSDLDIRLITPSGKSLMLTSAMGNDGDHYEQTCFSMLADQHILRAGPPYTGTFRPFSNLGNANHQTSAQGTWILRILDTYAYADQGELLDWSLTFGPNPPVPDPVVGTSLPVIVMTTDSLLTIPNEPKIPGTMKVFFDENGGLNFPFGVPVLESRMAIEVRGASSQSFPKKSFGFETQDEEGDGIDVEILGLPEEEDWILYAPYTDKSFLRDAITYQLGNDLGPYAPRTRAVEFYLNGDYMGIYWLEEKIKRDKNRVDIKKLNPADTLGDVLTGGYILKVDRDDGPGTYLVSEHKGTFEAEEIRIVYEDPEGPDLHPKQQAYIRDFIADFENALFGDDFSDPVLGYKRYVDVRSAVDFFIISELGHNVDAYRLSTFLYKDRDSEDSLLHFGPLWDFNLAYGNVDYCNCQFIEGWAYENSGSCGNTPRWWARFLEDPEFQNHLRCRYDSLRQTVLSTAAVLDYIDVQSEILASPQSRNYDRWPILGMYIWPNFYIGDTYQQEVNYMKQWLIGRLNWMDEHLPGECLPPSSTDPVAADAWRMDPNPASTSFTIRMTDPSAGAYQLEVLDTKGIVHTNRRGLNGDTTIDLTRLPQGMYFVRITLHDGRIAVRTLAKI